MIDCAVHPIASSDELREYMPAPYKLRSIPGPRRHLYQVPAGEFDPRAAPPGFVYTERAKFELESGAPAVLPYGDPGFVKDWLFGDGKLSYAVLAPLTRGILPDAEHGTAVCRATNEWLADRWLPADRRFLASIRVNPMDPPGAVEEIHRWATNPAFVQVTVTTQSLQPYGQRHFFPIWEAASAAGLPVYIHTDFATGIEYWPTPVGYPSHFSELTAYQPCNSFLQLVSLIAEGVMERLPGLRIICGDGGQDFAAPLMWRFDKSWHGLRVETPGAVSAPSRYLSEQVHFVWHHWEGAGSPDVRAEWMKMGRASEFLVYGSNYPYWDLFPLDEARSQVDELGLDPRVLGQNARDLLKTRLAGFASRSSSAGQ
jgi:predicted TIM-barrel fold metal-dependent hydrolase